MAPEPDGLDGQQHQTHHVNGIRLHTVEQGEGPLVVLLHGFPESWYSWRHQLPALAGAGFRAVAIDVRGYGRSSKPTPVDEYRMLCLVADNVALVEALGETEAVVVGHDWGAPIAWASALLRPDLFRGVAGLSVPYSPPSDTRPSDAFRAMGGAEQFYIEYFQQPGRAEAEIEADVRDWLLGFYFTASGNAPALENLAHTMATIPHGSMMRDRFRYPDAMPAWLSEADLEVYAGEFERSGFTGGLNRYRCIDHDFEEMSVYRHHPIEVPALYIGGDRDGPTIWGRPAIDRFAMTLPKLHRSVILDGCGHWTQQERPDEVNEALIEFLGAL
jgi:pimeloyl-ACP methyl ester carboxylesterase